MKAKAKETTQFEYELSKIENYELYEKLKEMHMVNQALDRHKLVQGNASLCVGCLSNLPATKSHSCSLPEM